jgi:ribosomal protein S18 acetylase RimI-like enzyme
MEIRKAVANDIPEIKKLFWELDTDAIKNQPEHFQRSERTENYIMEIIESQKSDFLVAVLNNEITGFSLLNEKEVKGMSLLIPCKYAYLQDFIVQEKYRNRGIGTQLLKASKQWAKEHNMEYLRLSVFPTNDSGIRFYKRHGLLEQMLTMECSL